MIFKEGKLKGKSKYVVRQSRRWQWESQLGSSAKSMTLCQAYWSENLYSYTLELLVSSVIRWYLIFYGLNKTLK